MTRTRIVFEPPAVMPAGVDPVTKRRYLSRYATSEEQRDAAVAHATAWMTENRVWTVEVEVAWTRRPRSVLAVKGHAEHVGAESIVVPTVDDVTEWDLEGRAIVRSLAEEQAELESELVDIYANPLE